GRGLGEGAIEVATLVASLLPNPLPEGERAYGLVLDDDLTIACGSGALRPTLLPRAGRGGMTAAELLRGFPIPAGTRLS
ncbi:hypothetical protein ABTJ92_22270, partial [Acinetobacter baumannii]